jgi:hypothetical protein
MADLEVHHVYRSLNERFTIAGYNAVECLITYFLCFYGMVFGGVKLLLATFVVSLALMAYGKRKDPRFFIMVFTARRFAQRLDAIRSSEVLWFKKPR